MGEHAHDWKRGRCRHCGEPCEHPEPLDLEWKDDPFGEPKPRWRCRQCGTLAADRRTRESRDWRDGGGGTGPFAPPAKGRFGLYDGVRLHRPRRTAAGRSTRAIGKARAAHYSFKPETVRWALANPRLCGPRFTPWQWMQLVAKYGQPVAKGVLQDYEAARFLGMRSDKNFRDSMRDAEMQATEMYVEWRPALERWERGETRPADAPILKKYKRPKKGRKVIDGSVGGEWWTVQPRDLLDERRTSLDSSGVLPYVEGEREDEPDELLDDQADQPSRLD